MTSQTTPQRIGCEIASQWRRVLTSESHCMPCHASIMLLCFASESRHTQGTRARGGTGRVTCQLCCAVRKAAQCAQSIQYAGLLRMQHHSLCISSQLPHDCLSCSMTSDSGAIRQTARNNGPSMAQVKQAQV